MAFQSVLVVLVPEAEFLVGPFRSQYDSSAADGMPAHITINYPFRPIDEDEVGTIDSLRRLFVEHSKFSFSLADVKRFPGLLYLEPLPRQPFDNLIQTVAKRFPQSPPYGGMFEDVIPHLTVASAEDGKTLQEIYRQFAAASTGKLPIKAAAHEIWLMDNREGRWARRFSFSLA